MIVASIFAFLSWLHFVCVCVLNSSVWVLYTFFKLSYACHCVLGDWVLQLP